MEQVDTINFKVILPSKILPAALSHIKSVPVSQFLVGYRNVLVQTESGVEWGLIKNNAYSGRAFVFDISETEAHNIQEIKRSSEYIQMVGNNYILLKIEKQINKISKAISDQSLSGLLEEIGGNTKININLIKSSFDNYEEFKEVAGQATKRVGMKEITPERSLVDKVKLQFNGKRLSGMQLFEVPTILKETGNWSEDKTVTLKLILN